MAGTYTKKDFSTWPEEQTLLKDSNGTKAISKGSEPVRLSPGWEGTGAPDDELNFKGVTMDRANLELNPPKDRLNIVYLIMVLHGIGALTSWNMFITAKNYFVEFKLSNNYTGITTGYSENFVIYIAFASQIPNLLFNWINVFMQFGGNLTKRIVWGIFVQIIIFILTVILAMVDTSAWPGAFFWITMICIVIMNTANGIYQNSVFGLAAKLPIKYTGAVVLGSNISGTLTAFISLLSQIIAPNLRTAAIYYFITAIFILLACFDTYFALPINRFYRYHELLFEKESKKKKEKVDSKKIPYLKIFRQCFIQFFNIFFVFFITLSIFPGMQSEIKKSDPSFIVPTAYYSSVMCFVVFNVTAMLGSFVASFIQWPKKNYLIIFVLLRILYIPLFLFCNFQSSKRILPVYIDNDWAYLVIGVTMGLSSGYLSSLGMMYCPREVEPQYASTAGMFGAAALISGVFCGLAFAPVMPMIASNWSFEL